MNATQAPATPAHTPGAAAQELLAVCRRVLGRSRPEGWGWGQIYAEAEAALAKAEGRAG